MERTKLLRALSARGWSNDEAQVIERGRSAESLRLIGPIVEDSEVRVSAVPIEKVTAQYLASRDGETMQRMREMVRHPKDGKEPTP